MQIFELSILNKIQEIFRCEFLDTVLPVLTRICDHGEIWIILAICLLFSKKYRKAGLALSCALILDLFCCNFLLKPLIGRVRPFAINPAIILLVSPPTDPSFPSGHAAASFAAAFALLGTGNYQKSCKHLQYLWISAMVLAIIISFSRLYLYLHWPTDILGGALLGMILGLAAARLVHRWDTLRKI